jgi:hypothetical protein
MLDGQGRVRLTDFGLAWLVFLHAFFWFAGDGNEVRYMGMTGSL